MRRELIFVTRFYTLKYLLAHNSDQSQRIMTIIIFTSNIFAVNQTE